MTVAELADRVREGEARAVSRAITLVENETTAAGPLLAALNRHAGRASLVGLTGPPGAGKSTLADALTAAWRRQGSRVAVLAIDPTSPFTGGALLGDRIRMQQHAGDAGVFIRSMATRGQLGGLARATRDAALVLDAAGFDVVLIETLGVGQDEVDIIGAADVSIVVVVPGAGDEVQALKAGIMEIADIFVVNKADLPGADRAEAAIAALLSLQGPDASGWIPPVLRTDALAGGGIEALVEAIARFLATDTERVRQRRRTRAERHVRDLVVGRLLRYLEEEQLAAGEFDAVVDRVAAREIDAHSAAATIVERLVRP